MSILMDVHCTGCHWQRPVCITTSSSHSTPSCRNISCTDWTDGCLLFGLDHTTVDLSSRSYPCWYTNWSSSVMGSVDVVHLFMHMHQHIRPASAGLHVWIFSSDRINSCVADKGPHIALLRTAVLTLTISLTLTPTLTPDFLMGQRRELCCTAE